MNICKYYVNGKCHNENCKFKHINNICRNYFFGECNRINCKFTHNYKFQEQNNNNKNKIKNTESFIPNYDEPTIRILFNKFISNDNEVCIINNMFFDKNLYDNLVSEINNDVYKPWHGDTHLIADDSHKIDWKLNSSTFDYVIKHLCSYFCMTASATRLNYYVDSEDWKPYHHDAAALKPDKAKTQNITVGVSFGMTRDISFQSIHKNPNDRIKINFELENGIVYAFGNKVNIDFKHGIPPVKKNNSKSYNGRFSIIIWGFSSLILSR
jgi:hypothetical protein